MTEQQIAQLKSSTVYQDILNYITDQSKDSQIALSAANVDKLMSEILLNNVNAEWLPERLKSEIKKLDADTNQTNYNWNTYMPAMLILSQLNGQSQRELNKSVINMNQKQLEVLAEQIVNLHNDNAASKAVFQAVENMPNGAAKSFMYALLYAIGVKNPFK